MASHPQLSEMPDHHHIPSTNTSHPDNPVPEEPPTVKELLLPANASPRSSVPSLYDTESATDSDSSDVPPKSVIESLSLDQSPKDPLALPARLPGRPRRASTKLISQNADDIRRVMGVRAGNTRLIEKVCCGGGCCFLNKLDADKTSGNLKPLTPPDNNAFRSLKLDLGVLSLESELDNIAPLPEQTVSFQPHPKDAESYVSTVTEHPPTFVTPHPPYEVYSAPIHHARSLTQAGAERRTYHFDLDVTDYPAEGGNVDFVVGGAVGICAPNDAPMVNQILDRLCIPNSFRDRPVTLLTTNGRWPTIWGDEKPRSLTTTRRELLTWCADVQSYPPTKHLLRLLAAHTSDPTESKILTYLCSSAGQASFCDLRTGPHLTLLQLLLAFPSSFPPLDHLLSTLPALMPRFYSLSADPFVASDNCPASGQRRLIEIAVTVHETPNWDGSMRTGVGSGYFERCAARIAEASERGDPACAAHVSVPLFRGLMSNPLAKEFVGDGPMLLIGAGVGVAPFRGFVQRRLRNANCANKVWVLQGVRDSLLDELYSGEWGIHEDEVKKVVQSRKSEKKYVQEEVRHQADLVWFVINALDGRVFVCGSSQGMGEGVERALVDVAIDKGKLNEEEAQEFWKKKTEAGQYIAVSIPIARTFDCLQMLMV
ncbi:MAG: hypothetical protein M1814_005608 [Vezdaea aestivalis]|nr:MAG: hypothetical protein M1814_005608 [Vezdaea aestivalis]